MSEQIHKQHRHHKRVETTPEIQGPAGGPDEITIEALGGVILTLERIEQVLAEPTTAA